MLSDLKTGGATAGRALVNWWRAVSIEALCCAILWLVGLLLIRVPLAPLWALIAGLMTFIPNFGAVIGLLGPVFIDQLLLQPLLMKRVTRVPIWASLLVPLVLGVVIPFWGVLLAPPLLAVVYAFRKPTPKESTAIATSGPES